MGEYNFNFHGNVDNFAENCAMTQNQIDLFKESCFGRFLSLPTITRSSKLISNLMLRTGYYEGQPQSADKLLIELGGTPREFTKQHYADIMGLKLAEDYNFKEMEYTDVMEKGLFDETFQKGALASRGNISAFIEPSKEWGDVKRTRFLLLHFLYNVLLSGQPVSPLPTSSYIKMVDDPDAFNNFPWGNVAWDYFMSGVRSFVTKAKTKRGTKSKPHLPGFLHPLQVWAYECIPRLQERGFCTVFNASADPLLLKWSSNSKVTEGGIQRIGLNDVEFRDLGSEKAGDEEPESSKPSRDFVLPPASKKTKSGDTKTEVRNSKFTFSDMFRR